MTELADETDLKSVADFSVRVRSPLAVPHAELMELGDMQDLGSCAERYAGSIPAFCTIYRGVAKW